MGRVPGIVGVVHAVCEELVVGAPSAETHMTCLAWQQLVGGAWLRRCGSCAGLWLRWLFSSGLLCWSSMARKW